MVVLFNHVWPVCIHRMLKPLPSVQSARLAMAQGVVVSPVKCVLSAPTPQEARGPASLAHLAPPHCKQDKSNVVGTTIFVHITPIMACNI